MINLYFYMLTTCGSNVTILQVVRSVLSLSTSCSVLYTRLRNIVSSEHAVLFMKGTPAFPLCGLSGSVCLLLKRRNLEFKSIDVLQDPELHLFLRERHIPASVPYLYIDGNFIGGYDELMHMLQDEGFGELYKNSSRSFDSRRFAAPKM